MSARVALSTLRLFFVRVHQLASGCWEWRGTINGSGYGTFNRDMAHRAAFQFFVRPLLDGEQIDHLCRNKRCVNPAHLQAVTASENGRRAVAVRGPFCRNGHELTPENVRIWRTGKGKTCRYCLRCRRESRERVKARVNHAA